MTNRERVRRAIEFRGPDRVPLMHGVLRRALLVHGRALVDMLNDEFPDDLGARFSIPKLDDLDGTYCQGTFTDAWGVTWMNERDGMLGIPVGHPLSDWDNYATYQLPPNPGDDWYPAMPGIR